MNAIVPLSLMRPAESRVLWTDEAIETAIRLSANGRSAGEIANAMRAEHPGVTRNAVIGKLHRMGFAGGGQRPSKDKPKAYPLSVRALRPTEPAPRVGRGVRHRSERVERHVERAAAPVQTSAWITICDLTESVCAFPSGDPRDLETFRYCGASIGEGERYCGGHRRIMYRPAPKNMEL
jgi:GcrA cell cycle regulator